MIHISHAAYFATYYLSDFLFDYIQIRIVLKQMLLPKVMKVYFVNFGVGHPVSMDMLSYCSQLLSVSIPSVLELMQPKGLLRFGYFHCRKNMRDLHKNYTTAALGWKLTSSLRKLIRKSANFIFRCNICFELIHFKRYHSDISHMRYMPCCAKPVHTGCLMDFEENFFDKCDHCFTSYCAEDIFSLNLYVKLIRKNEKNNMDYYISSHLKYGCSF